MRGAIPPLSHYVFMAKVEHFPYVWLAVRFDVIRVFRTVAGT